MKKILIIAGPNGAGKTIFAEEASIYDGSQSPPLLLDTGDNRPPGKLMEDPVEFRTTPGKPRPVKPLDDSGDRITSLAKWIRLRNKDYVMMTDSPGLVLDAARRPEVVLRYVNHHFDQRRQNLISVPFGIRARGWRS